MPVFDDDLQQKKLDEIRAREEEELARILSEKYNLRYVDLSQEAISTDALRLISEEEARAAELVIFGMANKHLSIAVRTPNNENVVGIIETLQERGYEPKLFMASRRSLDRGWALYKEVTFAVETKEGMIDISGDEIKRMMEAMSTIADAKAEIERILSAKKLTLTSRILETIVAGGLATRASDIHLEPEESSVTLRYRLDGVLTEVLKFPTSIYKMLNSRIKLLSGLKINIKDTAQDGRFSVGIDTKDIEIRTSILPGAYGESIVMRILDPSSIAGSMEDLGMEPTMLAMLEEELMNPNGMILNTGPTGSGKTTTLYAFLQKIHQPGIKIITIEDPIEYHLPGIVQTQVEGDRYTFASGLRSTLRQDPDVIMVGEIRDHEVAATAVHAALTGHLVFSTLHTNNAAGAFPRLVDIGVDRNIIGSALNVVMAQRLVRMLVPESKREVPLTGKQKVFIDQVLAEVVNPALIPKNTSVVWEPDPDAQHQYKGRKGVFEAVRVTETIEEVLRSGGGAREIDEEGRKQGYLSMKQHAVIKALNGETSLSEVERVLGSNIE